MSPTEESPFDPAFWCDRCKRVQQAKFQTHEFDLERMTRKVTLECPSCGTDALLSLPLPEGKP